MRHNDAKGMSSLVKTVHSSSAHTGHREPSGTVMHRAKIERNIPSHCGG
jgi:hypothetical protein